MNIYLDKKLKTVTIESDKPKGFIPIKKGNNMNRILKYIIAIALGVLFGLSIKTFGQNMIHSPYYSCELDSIKADSIKYICQERGHIESQVISTTLAYYAPRYVDLPDRILMIIFDQNTKEYICQRCMETIREPVMIKPDTLIIWRDK